MANLARACLLSTLYLLHGSVISCTVAFYQGDVIIATGVQNLQTKYREHPRQRQLKLAGKEEHEGPKTTPTVRTPVTTTLDRRKAVSSIVASGTAFLLPSKSTQAITKEYPSELTYRDSVLPNNYNDLDSLRKSRMSDKKATNQRTMDSINENPLVIQSQSDLISIITWAGALWLLAGSRSNPLVNPVANALYEPDEQFLEDRNEGYFSSLPGGLLFILAAVFIVLGFVVDRVIVLITEGDRDIALQLAGVSLIAGGALELGRIAAGEKGRSRQDSNRTLQLQQEFDTFAEQRLIQGGNVHRSEIANAFRRFYSKYRSRDNEEYPLSGLEIERLMRAWGRQNGNYEMTSAGYFGGVQLKKDADIVMTQR